MTRHLFHTIYAWSGAAYMYTMGARTSGRNQLRNKLHVTNYTDCGFAFGVGNADTVTLYDVSDDSVVCLTKLPISMHHLSLITHMASLSASHITHVASL